MKKTLVYDLPTRFFHWSFAIFFLSSYLITQFVGDDSILYPVHMLIGLLLSLTVLLRIIWGIFGSRYAKFSSLELNPLELMRYFSSILSSKTTRKLGHNPASAWASVIMMALALGLAVTGILMARGINKDLYEDIHELFANAFIIVAVLHVAGIILHTFKHRDAIGMSMIHGKKEEISEQVGVKSSHSFAGFLFLTFIGAFGFYLNKNYDSSAKVLNLFGATLHLGDSEGSEDEGHD